MDSRGKREGTDVCVCVYVGGGGEAHLCFKPPPDPRGDLEPPVPARPPFPTLVLEAALYKQYDKQINRI